MNNVAVIADVWKIENKEQDKNVTVSLPSIEWLTSSIKASGNMDIPLYGLTDSLSANVKTDGTSTNSANAIKPGFRTHEFRWIKSTVKNGKQVDIHCKAFLKMLSKNIPGIDVEPQESQECSYDYEISRYQYYEDGKEIFLIDKIGPICKINGKDYLSSMRKFLK